MGTHLEKTGLNFPAQISFSCSLFPFFLCIRVYCCSSTLVLNRKNRINSYPIIHVHYPTSEGVSDVSEWANESAQWSARAKWVVWNKPTSEPCERTSEWTNDWPSTYIWVLGGSGPQCSCVTWALRQAKCTLRTHQWCRAKSCYSIRKIKKVVIP